jgi:hypothetical protein
MTGMIDIIEIILGVRLVCKNGIVAKKEIGLIT